MPSIDSERGPDVFELGYEARYLKVRRVAGMIGSTAVELIAQDYRTVAGERRGVQEISMRAARPAVDENDWRLRATDIAVDANIAAAAGDGDHGFAARGNLRDTEQWTDHRADG